MAELLITLPQGQTRTHPLGAGEVVLGRDPTCDIPLADLSASRRHVVIRREGNGYVLEDLGSKNGTIVNDTVTRLATLRNGDEILIGAVRAVFRDEVVPGVETSVVIADDSPRQESTTYRGEINEQALSRRRLEILYELTERLTRLRERDALLSDAMDVCFEMLRFERGAIAVKQAKGNMVDWPVVRNLRGNEGELKVSRTILSNALVHGERVIVNDADAAMVDPTLSMVRNNIRSAMCVPLMSGDINLGVIYGDRVTSGTTYSKDDIDFLAGLARLVTTGLVNARLLEEQKLKVALESEVNMARQIQTGLFPAALPDRQDVTVAALNHPGYHVSGDYYDVIDLGEGRLAFLVADVTGEGVSASLLMANLQAAVRMSVPTGQSPGALLEIWNNLIARNTDASRFITCLLGILDPKARTVRLSVAGHHPPYLVTVGGQCSVLEIQPELPLGVLADEKYGEVTIELPPEPCTIVAYTDGVCEAMNDRSELYGVSRVASLLSSTADASPQRMIDRLRHEVKQHCGHLPQGDDITILALRLNQPA